jgi:hypothetical protein
MGNLFVQGGAAGVLLAAHDAADDLDLGNKELAVNSHWQITDLKGAASVLPILPAMDSGAAISVLSGVLSFMRFS